MLVNRIIYEDFSNYKKPSMFIGVPICTGKCWRELGLSPDTCQNNDLLFADVTDYPISQLCEAYLANPITESVVFGGLEPFETFGDVYSFVGALRNDYSCDDEIVIYTGFNKSEILEPLKKLTKFPNIVVKFGRYVPGQKKHFDPVLGVDLASDNQYAEVIS